MSSKYDYKIPFEHCKKTLGWDSEECETRLAIAEENDATISQNGILYIYPERLSKFYVSRAGEMILEITEGMYEGSELISLRTCEIMLNELFFFTDYIIGATEYSDTIPSVVILKSVFANLLADYRKIQKCQMEIYELLLKYVVTAVEKSDSSKFPFAGRINF